jgi:hypothetical protein
MHHTEDYHSPTVSAPTDNTLTGTYLAVTIERFIIFDSRTGNILSDMR